MTGIEEIRGLRFEGMDIPQLLDWIGKIKQGRGAESMHEAVQALDECVRVVVDLDETLRTELGKLGVAWEGNAGALAQEASAQRSVVLQESEEPLRATATSVDAQGRSFESARNTLPNGEELRHQESEHFFEWAGGGFGYESDYDQEAKQIAQQRSAAQAALGSYRDGTVGEAEKFRPLPEMGPALVSPQGLAATTGTAGVAGGGAAAFGGVATGGGAVGGTGTGVGGGVVPGTPGSGGGSADPRGGGYAGVGNRPDAPSSGSFADRTPSGGGRGGIGVGTALGIGAGGAAA
ncbi:hypothetical protein AB8O55_05630, partial [Saccharopolyspora cebuensis]